MKTLNYQLKQLCRNNRDGSYTTQAGRERQLTLIANQLDALGYRTYERTVAQTQTCRSTGEALAGGGYLDRIREWALSRVCYGYK